jgi:hypothetical protein
MLRALLYCCAQWFEWCPMTGLASDEMIEGNGTSVVLVAIRRGGIKRLEASSGGSQCCV